MSYVMNNIRITGYTEDIQYFMNDYLEIKDNKPHLDFSEYEYQDEEEGVWINTDESCNIRALEGVATITQHLYSKWGLQEVIEDLSHKYTWLMFEISTHSTGMHGGNYHKFYGGDVREFNQWNYDLDFEELEHKLKKINLYVEPQEDLF